MAQIMAYHQKPSSYNGHYYNMGALSNSFSISVNSPYADNVAYLVHDIGVTVSTIYGERESSTYLSNVPSSFHKFGYTSAVKNSYSTNNVTNSLDDSLPVFMFAVAIDDGEKVGHMWVIDGYYRVTYDYTYYALNTKNVVDRQTKNSFYMHCNWGWGGNYNSYCLSDIYELGSYIYDRDFAIVDHIY